MSRAGKWEGTPCAGLLLLHNKDSSNKGTKLKVERKLNCEKPAAFTEESAGKGGRRGGQLFRELNPAPALWFQF